ncbi:hypothetical protein [Subdoligranulum variabile]|uniref:DUF4358 domain-containing protein n=1 Tax=Subdoligranulum variabile DSM 15176 TaxID=411471 RepID=D1PJ78_9FIRM|nr:hypothetical protein [Subdoligranulum variabile]EFB77238.1 hypothetical protein SUBVAR_04398 [Subdoligranulum variabile DSM 15176]UWP67463.1 hypothetical protein NQ490_10985 [Subdoligranulum variabile]
MKKALFCLSLAAALLLAACSNTQEPTEATPTPLPDEILNDPVASDDGVASDPGMEVTPETGVALTPDAELSGMVDKIYEAYPVELMMLTTNAIDLSDASWCTYHTGLTADQAALVDAGVYSESLTGSQAYSLVLLRVKDEADAQTIADAVLENVQMNKWVCVMADKARVATFGDKVLFVMTNSELTDVDALMDAVPGALGVTFDYTNSKDAEI